MIKLIRYFLAPKHHFDAFIRKPGEVEKAYVNAYEQEELIIESLSKGQNTVFMGMHENYIEYASFGYPKPIFISLVRDPVEKEISWYYYIRSNLYDAANRTVFKKQMEQAGGEYKWRHTSFDSCVKSHNKECQFIPMNSQKRQGYKRQSLQFCGNYEACWAFNSPLAVQMAKDNIERNFAVVGLWEEADITLTVLERYIPKYFKGALKLYKNNIKKISETNRNHHKPSVSREVKQMLYKNFTNEMDLYNFCKQRLYLQYLAVVDRRNLKF